MAVNQRSGSFDHVAVLYDKLRPGYPRSFVREIIKEVGVHPAKIKAFEIGCGTGKATADFAQRLLKDSCRSHGLRIKAIDPGQNLLEVANSKFISHPQRDTDCKANTLHQMSSPEIEFVLSRAEDYNVTPEEERSYDLVYAAQSFHYVDLKKGLLLCHRLLKPTGLLALFWSPTIYRNSPDVIALNRLHAEYLGPTHLDWVLNQDRAILEELKEIESTKLFNQLQLRWCNIKKIYSTAASSAKNWQTTSHFILMSPEKQKELLKREKEIYHSFGGKMENYSGIRLFLGRPA